MLSSPRSLCIALALLTATAYARAAPADFPLTLRDDLQRDVRLEHPPQRIVSLLPSLTETLCALGACNRLVGTDRYSDWPPEVTALPKTGGLDDAQVELIVRLQPDLVLLSHAERITDRLSELGIRSFALTTQTYASIAHTVTAIGMLLGVPERAALLNQTIDAAVHEVSSRFSTERRTAAPSVYFEIDRAPFAAGSDSFIGEELALLGARNIVTPDLGPFPKLNPEYVVRHNPDVIFVSPSEVKHLADRPGWSEIRAVKEQRICAFEPSVRDTIVRPGPRVAEGMQALADCLARVSR